MTLCSKCGALVTPINFFKHLCLTEPIKSVTLTNDQFKFNFPLEIRKAEAKYSKQSLWGMIKQYIKCYILRRHKFKVFDSLSAVFCEICLAPSVAGTCNYIFMELLKAGYIVKIAEKE